MKNICIIIFCFFSHGLLWAQLPSNMYADSAYAPFLYGVASFDPSDSQVIIWTHITPDSTTQSYIEVDWEVATDTSFLNVIQSGMYIADTSRDWTVTVDVPNLTSYTTYYYRFKTSNNKFTPIGRTRTSPSSTSNNVDHIRMGVFSCSSIYSGFFNSYQQVAQRLDLDAILHLGDYIYDFVDADEEIRVPTPYPTSPVSKQEWRDRQKYYLLDPDLRAARQVHPWIVIWDNHDTEYNGTVAQAIESREAFLEYVPMRLLTPTDTKKIYRKFNYGGLLDIFMIDILLYRDIDNLPSGDPSILGNLQYNWLTTELQNSTAKWKLVGNQKMMCGWSVANIPTFFPATIGNGSVLDPNSWDGYDPARDRLLDFIDNNNINNIMVLSGDAHVSMASDLHQAPTGSNYNSSTGAGAVAVEFLPTSITRGNFDEMGYPGWVVSAVEGYMASANPNQVFSNIVDHGYGILDFKPDSAIAEFWYTDILNPTTNQSFERGLLLKDSENHWHRTNMSGPTLPKDYSLTLTNENKIKVLPSTIQMTIFPNPSQGIYTLVFELEKDEKLLIDVLDFTTAEVLFTISDQLFFGKESQQITFDVNQLPAGTYFLRLQGQSMTSGKVFVKK
ncbi:alkaline phosphatase D family protein [Aureispira]|nr:alkaline phosphatase D family protein [Aureispira sp.]